jgi:hypothetical protein
MPEVPLSKHATPETKRILDIDQRRASVTQRDANRLDAHFLTEQFDD